MSGVTRLRNIFAIKSPKLNYFYNVLYKIFGLLIPIITTPYISVVLGAEKYGEYSYITTYVVYFTLFAALGFSTYGERLIASHRNDIYQKSVAFWGVTISRLITVSFAVSLYSVLAAFRVYGDHYNSLVWIRGISLITILLNFTFVFSGEEDFIKIFLFSAISKIIGLIAIFIFVKTQNDIWKYALIIECEAVLSLVSLIPFLFKRIRFVKLKDISIWPHLKKAFLLFLPTIAISLYPVIDKTIIGLITNNDSNVGVYNKAQQLIDAISSFTLSLGIVFSPRNSYLFSQGRNEEAKENIYNAFNFVFLFSFACCFGILSVGRHLCGWYIPDDSFSQVPLFMSILSPVIIFGGIHNIITVQYLIPIKKDKTALFASILALIVNVVVTTALTFFFGYIGAAIGTITSEIAISVFLILKTRKDIKYKRVFSNIWKYLLASVIMALICFALRTTLPSSLVYTLVIVFVGAMIYFLALWILKDEFVSKVITKVTSFLLSFKEKVKNNSKFIKFLHVLLFLTFFLTAFSYAPIALRIGLNKYVVLLWVPLFIISLPFGFGKIKKMMPIILFIWLPFFIYIFISSLILKYQYLTTENTRVIIISMLVFLMGISISGEIHTNIFKTICVALIIANIIVSFDIFIEYFRDFSFSTINYVYAGKNAVSTNILLAIWLTVFIKFKSKIFTIFAYIMGALMFVLLLMLKSRAAIITIPFIVIIEILNASNSKFKRIGILSLFVLSVVLVIAVPVVRDLVINKILFANHGSEGIDGISSGRFSLIAESINIFSLSPIVGIGDYYVDFAPIQWATTYGIVGAVLLLPFVLVLFIPIIQKRYYKNQMYNFYFVILVVFLINMFFEAFPPFGPGIRTFVLWFLCGVLASKYDFSLFFFSVDGDAVSIKYSEISV